MTASDEDPQLKSLLEFLRESRGLDFTGYKRPSLTRRIRKRMDDIGVGEFDEYRDRLEVDPEEPARLVDTILINVTGFFRDESAWTYLAEHVVPGLVDAKGSDEPIRAWCAGCASGEEAYSLAMVFADHLGLDEFKRRVKIFATDTDQGALAQARTATYTANQLEPVGADRQDQFFDEGPSGFVLRSDVRCRVIFGLHDVTRDPPISRLDLLACRNLLMYLVSDTQRRVLTRFHQALRPGGYLFLGKAETIFAHSDLFTPVESSLRLFKRSPTRRIQFDDLVAVAPTVDGVEFGASVLQDLALAATPVAQLVIDIDGRFVGANTKARAMFSLTTEDLGRAFADLEVFHRPVELQSLIEQAYVESTPIVVRDASRSLADGKVQFLEVTVVPLTDSTGVELGSAVTFADVTELGRTRVELEQSARETETVNVQLQAANVELETSNEELQSTNEELETTNEELQSANEELETMNEELQSANDQLGSMNTELIDQAGLIEQGEQFLASILDSLSVGVAVLTDEFDIVLWNRAAEDLFGFRAEETAGRSFLALDIGLPVGDVAPLLHEMASEPSKDGEPDQPRDVVLDAINRRGQQLKCRVTVGRLAHPPNDTNLVVLMDPLPPDLS